MCSLRWLRGWRRGKRNHWSRSLGGSSTAPLPCMHFRCLLSESTCSHFWRLIALIKSACRTRIVFAESTQVLNFFRCLLMASYSAFHSFALPPMLTNFAFKLAEGQKCPFCIIWFSSSRIGRRSWALVCLESPFSCLFLFSSTIKHAGTAQCLLRCDEVYLLGWSDGLLSRFALSSWQIH